MKPREWGVLEVCLRLTCGGKNFLFLDGRKMAGRFSGIKKDAIYGAIEKLVASGWLVEVKRRPRRNKETQQYESTTYRVLTHDQWVRRHGVKKCSKSNEDASREIPNGPVVESRTEPVVISREPVGDSREPVGFSREPVVKSRHISVQPCSVNESSVKESSVEAGHEPDLVSPRPLRKTTQQIAAEFQARRRREREGA